MISKKSQIISRKSLTKMNSSSLLSNIFSFIPKKIATQILQINKKLSSSLNLTIADYLLDKQYQDIIKNSKGDTNYIFYKSFELYQHSPLEYSHSPSKISFTKLIQKIIKYLNYLYIKKEFKKYSLSFDNNIYTNWMYFQFFIEVIRNLKHGLSLKINSSINYKYYEIIKDAIHNSEDIKAVTLYILKDDLKNNGKYFEDYFNFCDWTKIEEIYFSGSYVLSLYPQIKNKSINIYIPKDISIKKLVVDDKAYYNIKQLTNFILLHGKDIEYFKIYGFNDNFLFQKSDKDLNKEIFSNFVNLKKIKILRSIRLDIYSLLLIAQKSLSSIKVLALENITSFNSNNFIDMQSYFKNMFILLKKVNNLEKLEIGFNSPTTIIRSLQILSFIINNNPNIKDLKINISMKTEKNKISKNKEIKNQNARHFLENFVNINLVIKDKDYKSTKEINSFCNLIKAISTLKKLESLQLLFPLNNEMTELFNSYFNVGNSLNYLYIIHTYKLDLNNLIAQHANLNQINLSLIVDENNNSINKFKYFLSPRSWKSIELTNYPLNDSFVNSLINCKNSINYLALKDSMNISSKSDVELNNILLEIKNKH
jgi:hypothetical protein